MSQPGDAPREVLDLGEQTRHRIVAVLDAAPEWVDDAIQQSRVVQADGVNAGKRFRTFLGHFRQSILTISRDEPRQRCSELTQLILASDLS